MTIYKCEKCNKQFTKKTAYASHSMRISPCIKDNNINNECFYCHKTYSNKHNLKAHINICKKFIENNNQNHMKELEKILEKKYEERIIELNKKFEEKFEELEKKIESSSEKEINNITLTENDNSITNNTTNIFNIFSAGKEDLSRLTQEEIIKICTSGTYYPIVAAEIIHCNEKYPEFQNFLISNLRSATGQVLINDKWVTKSQDEILSTLLKVDKNHGSTLRKDLTVEDKLKIKLESTKDEIDTNECKEHMKEKIKNKLHSASKMISRNKKKLEKVIDNK